MPPDQITFNEPSYTAPTPDHKRSWLVQLVIKIGLATDDTGAQQVLWVILAIVVIAIILVWWL
jgi:hypothetical protein